MVTPSIQTSLAPHMPQVTWRWVDGLKSAAAIVARLAARLRGEVTARERLITCEGEYAARAVIDHEVAVGLVFAEDGYAQAVGGASLTRSDVRGVRLGLPALRRRRFLYTPPRGWRAMAGRLGTAWLNEDALLAVYPAQPIAGPASVDRMAEVVARGASFPAVERLAESVSLGGLDGQARVLAGENGHTAEVIVLDDGRFLYPLRVEGPANRMAELGEILRDLATSIQPLPRPPADTATFTQWVD